MKATIEALKKREDGLLGQASHYEEMAKQQRKDAEKLEFDASKLRDEAAEVARLVKIAAAIEEN